MNIEFKQIAMNRTRVWNRQIKFIVIHDTANVKKTANADMHFNYFNNAYRGASADFMVDDKKVLQLNDFFIYRTWHVGDGDGKYGITNDNSIGIELCINEGIDKVKARNNLIDLVIYLMDNLKLDITKVIRHYDASRKMCPNTMSANKWEEWNKLISDIKQKINQKEKPNKIEENLQLMVKVGIIKSPAYWSKKANEIEFFDLFLEGIANYIKKTESDK